MENNQPNKESKKNIIIAVAIVVVLAAVIIAAVKGGSGANQNDADNTAANTPVATEAPKITPIFMYFVSSADEGYEQTMAVIEELKAEYEGRIVFDIRDVTNDPEMAERYSAAGNTPMLIMSNADNNISAILPMCSDKEQLKASIEQTLE